MTESDMKDFEGFLATFSGGKAKVGTVDGRLAVSAACGYLDARVMVYMLETHGLPLTESAVVGRRHGLKVDFSDLKFELEMLRIRSGSKKEFDVEAQLQELRYFLSVFEANQNDATTGNGATA